MLTQLDSFVIHRRKIERQGVEDRQRNRKTEGQNLSTTTPLDKQNY